MRPGTPPPLLDEELRATMECRLITTGRVSGEPRGVRIWFATAGDRVYLLSQDQERAHWVRNAAASPVVRIRIGKRPGERTFEGRARVIGAFDDEDGVARDAWAGKYGTKYFAKFLREALVVAVDLEREID
jgi:hypothetical protein